MRKLLLYTTLLFLLQDAGEQTRPLVEKLKSGDLPTIDAATRDIYKIGPAALPELRLQSKKAQGDVDLKTRLDAIIAKLEREEKLTKVIGKLPRVVLKKNDAPIAEILKELSQQSGIPVEGVGLLPDMRASIDMDGTVWTAINDLCRSTGRLMFCCTPAKVEIHPEKYRSIPQVQQDGMWVLFYEMTRAHSFSPEAVQWAAEDAFWISGSIVRPGGTPPIRARIHFEDMEDGRKIPLAEGPGSAWADYEARGPARSAGILTALPGAPGVPPSVDAEALTPFRGRIEMTFAIEWRTCASIADPLAHEESAPGLFAVKSWSRKGDTVDAWVFYNPKAAKRVEEQLNANHGRVTIIGTKGERIESTESPDYRETLGTEAAAWHVKFTWREAALPRRFDLETPTDLETVKIPFDFKRIDLK